MTIPNWRNRKTRFLFPAFLFKQSIKYIFNISGKVALPTSNSSGSNSTGITGAASNSERGSESTLKANSTFVNKPARGWLHPDYLFAKDGINYNVRVSFWILCVFIKFFKTFFKNLWCLIFSNHLPYFRE